MIDASEYPPEPGQPLDSYETQSTFAWWVPDDETRDAVAAAIREALMAIHVAIEGAGGTNGGHWGHLHALRREP